MSSKQIIQLADDETTEWVEGENAEQIRIDYDVTTTKSSIFNNNLRLITTSKITPEIIKELEEGAPYGKIGTPDDVKYSQIISISITENLCDKLAAPSFIHNFETKYLPNPFPEEKARPLSQQTKAENEVLDDPEFIH